MARTIYGTRARATPRRRRPAVTSPLPTRCPAPRPAWPPGPARPPRLTPWPSRPPSVELGGAKYPTPLSRAPRDTAPPRGEAMIQHTRSWRGHDPDSIPAATTTAAHATAASASSGAAASPSQRVEQLKPTPSTLAAAERLSAQTTDSMDRPCSHSTSDRHSVTAPRPFLLRHN